MPHWHTSRAMHGFKAAAVKVGDQEFSHSDVECLMRLQHLTTPIWRWLMALTVLNVAMLRYLGLIHLGWVRIIIAAPVLSVIVWLLAEYTATQSAAKDTSDPRATTIGDGDVRRESAASRSVKNTAPTS